LISEDNTNKKDKLGELMLVCLEYYYVYLVAKLVPAGLPHELI